MVLLAFLLMLAHMADMARDSPRAGQRAAREAIPFGSPFSEQEKAFRYERLAIRPDPPTNDVEAQRQPSVEDGGLSKEPCPLPR